MDAIDCVLVREAHEEALFAPMESDAGLVVGVADIAEPVTAVVLAHGADKRAGNFVQLGVLGEADSEGFSGVVDLFGGEVPVACDSDFRFSSGKGEWQL